MATISNQAPEFEIAVDVLVVGAGGCGLSAALAAADGGAEVLVVERDEVALGTTAMSTGMIPAAGTPEQADQGIDDAPERFFDDIMRKTKGRTDPELVMTLARESAETVAWLRDRHGVPLSLVDDFLYPGHSRMRMYAPPNRSGGELHAALEQAVAAAEVPILTGATVETLFVDGDRVVGVEAVRADGSREAIGCQALVLASCGFGGDAEQVSRHIPEMANAVFHGHPGNKGEAMAWGEAMGAELADMGAYQGHGGLAAGHGVPILWPLIMEGGFQVNAAGERFSDESTGYSEQAARVNAQAGGVAWSIFDERLHRLMLAFDDYHDALKAGAVVAADSPEALAETLGLPPEALARTLAEVERMVRGQAPDPFGRDFTGKPPLAPPYRAAKVTGALFHTQGGLAVDGEARVKKQAGGVFPNLFAGGGAARGVSGPGGDGYIAGNGLLTATTLGKLAGRAAAKQVVGR